MYFASIYFNVCPVPIFSHPLPLNTPCKGCVLKKGVVRVVWSEKCVVSDARLQKKWEGAKCSYMGGSLELPVCRVPYQDGPPTHFTYGSTMYRTRLQSDFCKFWTPPSQLWRQVELGGQSGGLQVIDPELFEYDVKIITSSFLDDVIIHSQL